MAPISSHRFFVCSFSVLFDKKKTKKQKLKKKAGPWLPGGSLRQTLRELFKAFLVILQQPAFALRVVVKQIVLVDFPSLGPLLGQIPLAVLDNGFCGARSGVVKCHQGLGDILPDLLRFLLTLLLEGRDLSVKHLHAGVKEGAGDLKNM